MELNESLFKRQFIRQLLEVLLGKYEQSQSFTTGVPGKQRPQIVMQKSSFVHDYNDEMDFRKRQWMNEALAELERLGVTELIWAKFRTNSEINKVYLQWESVPHAYRLSGIVPLRDKLERLRGVLKPLADHPWLWVRNWHEKTDAGLAQGKSSHLDVDDPEGYADLVRTLNELPLSEGKVVSVRILSQRLFQDSKHLERQVMKRLLTLTRQASGEHRETDEEWLDFLGLARNPQSVLLCGPLDFQSGGKKVCTGDFPGGLGLSGQTIESMADLSTSARRIVTIENLSSYHQWLEQHAGLNGEELVIYTGGYPQRILQTFLKKLSNSIKNVTNSPETCHWGDIDLGGIRIFEYLKAQFFQHLQPLRMDADTLLKYESRAATVSSEYASQIRQALNDPQYADWHPLLNIMLERGVRLEQESIAD